MARQIAALNSERIGLSIHRLAEHRIQAADRPVCAAVIADLIPVYRFRHRQGQFRLSDRGHPLGGKQIQWQVVLLFRVVLITDQIVGKRISMLSSDDLVRIADLDVTEGILTAQTAVGAGFHLIIRRILTAVNIPYFIILLRYRYVPGDAVVRGLIEIDPYSLLHMDHMVFTDGRADIEYLRFKVVRCREHVVWRRPDHRNQRQKQNKGCDPRPFK